MTAVHPPCAAVGEAHLVAWTAGYLAAEATHRAELQAAHRAGYLAALEAVAVNIAELDIIGGAKDRRILREAAARVRQRRDDIEQRARDRYQRDGREEYRGGALPVWGEGDAA